MFSLGTLIMTSIISLAIGGALGAFALYLFRAQVYSREIEQRLHEAEGSLQSYQRDVAEHFAQTSQLVNNLTQSYRDIHEHLANSALKLATPAISRQILESANQHLTPTDKSYINEGQIEPPRDWAPKTAGSKGALSEDYDLEHEPQAYGNPVHHPITDGADHFENDDSYKKS